MPTEKVLQFNLMPQPIKPPIGSCLDSRALQSAHLGIEEADRAKGAHTLLKRCSQMGWKKAVGVIVIVGAMTASIAGTAQGATPAAGHRAYEGASTAVPQVEPPEQRAASSAYLSTHIDRDRSSGLQSMSSVTVTAAATRCPAFVTWEDWGGSRVHAYVDFRPSDWCNGRHVKRAYVRLIRQCGPYYDTGRIYTYTAGSTSDTQLYSVSAWILDSALWSCNTNTYYGYEYF
jgi:hypothetical protein